LDEAANLALYAAKDHCTRAGISADEHREELTALVIVEIRKAMAEIADHKIQGGPKAAIMLTMLYYQNIYFSDAGRQAAELFLEKLGISYDPGLSATQKRAARIGHMIFH
jgi:hypothetical protein